LSIEARKILDEAGFPDVAIVASNDLDERIIESLKIQGAKVSIWGVGTKLATAYDQPALGGVYKLGAIKDEKGNWQPKLKLSEQPAKSSIPGVLQVRRFENGGTMIGDMIYEETNGPASSGLIVDPKDPLRRKQMPAVARWSDLLVPVIRGGQIVGRPEPIESIRNRVQSGLARLHPSVRRFLNPHEYPVGIDLGLHKMRLRLVQAVRRLQAPVEEGL
jgi:nicotinate phosphoribosyltransferase